MKQKISDINKRVLFLVNTITVLFIILLFVFKHIISSLLYPICIAYFILLTSFCILFFGYKKDKKSSVKDRVNSLYIIFSILYLITIYLVGMAAGYRTKDFEFLGTIYLTVLVVLVEVFRYVVISKASKGSNESYIMCFITVLFDVLVLSGYSAYSFFDVLSLIVLTIVALIKNSMLTYTTNNFGFKPCILYAIIVTVFPEIIPFYPELGNYLRIVFLVVYTLTLFYNISKPNRKEDEETINEYEKGPLYYIERLVLVAIVIIIFFVSGVFKYSISAIASDSMYPELRKGDAVVLEKPDEENLASLKKGMIIAYKDNGQVITHRIFSIEEENGIQYITTKGDNNSTKDVTKKTKDDIIGIVRFKIPYVGYPSVEISEIKNRNKKEE